MNLEIGKGGMEFWWVWNEKLLLVPIAQLKKDKCFVKIHFLN